MAKVVIGTHTCTLDPQKMTMVRAEKPNASKLTYTSVAYFAWTPSIVGKEIMLEWPVMDAASFASLDVIYQANLPFTFTPSDGIGSSTYTVEMTSFNGDYFRGRGTTSASTRKNVKMTLLILVAL